MLSAVKIPRFGGVPTLPPLPPKPPPPPPANPPTSNARKDGRDPFTLRPVLMRAQTVTGAAGSCYYTAGETRVMASVWGPRQLPSTRNSEASEAGCLNVNVSVCPFASGRCLSGRVTANLGNPARLEAPHVRLPAQVLQAIEGVVMLSTFPNCEVVVAVTVITDDGCCLAACINAACASLATAGIAMRDSPCAVTLGVFIPRPLQREKLQEAVKTAPAAELPAGLTKAQARLLAKKAAAAKIEAPDDTLLKKLTLLPTIVVDPTDAEMLEGPYPGIDWEISTEIHLALCPSGATLVSATGLPFTPEIAAQIFQVGEAACCQLGANLLQTLKAEKQSQ